MGPDKEIYKFGLAVSEYAAHVRAFSRNVRMYLQVQYGFGSPSLGTIILYTISTIMYYAFFTRGKERRRPEPVPGD